MEALESLVERARTGQTSAYEELVRRFQDMAYGYAYSVLGDWHLAQDAAQEAFVEALKCLPTLRQARAFPGWFKRIVYKHCDRTMRRRDHQAASIETLPERPSHAPGPHEVIEQSEQQETVLQAVRCLPEREREVTMLYYIDGYSQAEIADFLEIPSSTVKSRLYTSRQRLKERITDMVRDTLQSNALPESFTEKTLAQAVARAAELNKEHQFDEAEGLLRDVLGKVPSHPGALKELNRTLMWGRVYGESRWDRLSELVGHGRAILASGSDDEYVYHQMAETLLAIPAMAQAVEFVEEWVDKKGPNIERLGMLAWAKGCVAEYGEAEALWNELLALLPESQPEEAATTVQHICMTLVDCFSSAGEMDRAARVAQMGWAACRDLEAFPHQYEDPPERRTDAYWLQVMHQAELPVDDIAQRLLKNLGPEPERDLLAQGVALSIRAWVDDAQHLTGDWLGWVKACVEAEEWKTLYHIHSQVGMSLRRAGRRHDLAHWGRATREWLKSVPGQEAESLDQMAVWSQYNGWTYLGAGDLEGTEQLAREAVADVGYVISGCFLIAVAALRGEPTPPDVVQFIEQEGIEAIDEYGMEGWYVIAREAAAAGDAQKAFEALERAINYWSNPPLHFDEMWEGDAYWGDLRDHPEYKRIYREKRERIGPIYGELHYFPGW